MTKPVGTMVLVVENSWLNEPHLPLNGLTALGLSVFGAHSSTDAVEAIRLHQPIVIFLAAELDDGMKGVEVQTAIRALEGEYSPSLIALDAEITPTQPQWRLSRRGLNLATKLNGLMKSVLMAQGFSQVLVVEDPRAVQKIPERVFVPTGCVRIGTYHTANLALQGVWIHKPSIIVVDEKLGVGSTGADFLRDLTGIDGYSPVVIGLSDRLTGADLTAERGLEFETRLRLALREACRRLERATNA